MKYASPSLHGGDRGPLEWRRPPLSRSVCAPSCHRRRRVAAAARADRSRREVERPASSSHQLRATERRPARSRTATIRETTGELTTQIQSLEDVIDELGARSALDPAQARAMQKLPAVVKARAAGGTPQTNAAISNVLSTSLTSPEDTFGVLRDSAAGPREPAAQRPQGRRAPGGAGRGDAVDLAGARLADRHVRRPLRSVHRRARLSPGPRHLDRRRANRSSRRRTAASSRRRTRATTAT